MGRDCMIRLVKRYKEIKYLKTFLLAVDYMDMISRFPVTACLLFPDLIFLDSSFI